MYKYKNSVFFKIIIPLSVFLFFSASAQATTLTISGNKFAIDGQAKFLVLAGFFDGMDAPNPSADLTYLKSKGFDGIRIFPNWWNELSPLVSDSDPLITSDGSLDQSKLNKLISIIDAANSMGLIVDISFAREVVEGNCSNPGIPTSVLCKTEFKEGVVAVAQALRSKTNIFYDLSNEHDYVGVVDFPRSDVLDLKNRIENAIGTGSILSVSTTDPNGSTAVGIANGYPMDMVNAHFASGQELNSNISAALTPGKPTYIGEPNKTSSVPGYSTQNLISAAVNAKKVGVAAWTFHTDAGFYLNGVSLQSKFEAKSNELGFVNSFKSAIDSTVWGGGGNNPPSNPSSLVACINAAPDPSVVPDMSSVVNAVASENPNWVLEACDNYNFIDEVVRRLRAGQGGTRWAYEAKRANPNDPWKEGVSYYYGTGNAPVAGSMSSYEVFAVDVLRQECPNNPSINAPYWGVADWPNNPPGTFNVAYMYPKTTLGGSLPTPVMCSGGVPATNFPTIINIDPTIAVPGQNVEVNGANLSNELQLTDNNGTIINVEGSANSQLTTTTFMVPSNITSGIYKVAVTNSKGSTTSTQSLTVQVGGASFSAPVTPSIPTQGLPTDLGQLVQQIFIWSLYILGISVFVMFFYSGFLWLTAAGNTSKIGEAKTHMTNAVFGAILLLSSYLILYTINPDFVKNTFNLPGLGTTNSNNTISAPLPSSLPLNNAASQIRLLNNLLNEYNNYNNAVNQLNTSNKSL